ncbi:MAG: aminoglycoside adenylyltransferase domain-containing protein [Anaerolineae bacterium]
MKLLDDVRIPDHPYPELREVLEIFVAEVKAELAENLVGIYLVGSLASGGFDADSDVDFLVVIHTELTEANIRNLQAIQRRIHGIDCYPAKHLEGSYISISDLNDWGTVGRKKLYYFDNGSTTFEWSVHDNNWHVRWILRERGITLVGEQPETLLRPIPPAELLSEMETSLIRITDAFTEAITRPLNFWNSRFGQSFAILTCCRILHTLHTGTVQSKKVGAKWARQHVETRWIPLLDQAWREREGVRFGVKIGQKADEDLLYETLEFMRYAATLTERVKVQPPSDQTDPPASA